MMSLDGTCSSVLGDSFDQTFAQPVKSERGKQHLHEQTQSRTTSTDKWLFRSTGYLVTALDRKTYRLKN